VLQQALLRIEPVIDAGLGTGPWAAVLFTSANAVRAIVRHRRFRELAGLPAYVVGPRTQAAAVAAGFAPVMSANADVNALAALIAANPPVNASVLPKAPAAISSPLPQEKKGVGIAQTHSSPAAVNLPLLYCAGEDQAGDLAGALRMRGLHVETVCVYRAAMVADLAPDVRAAFAGDAVDAVLHYSARTAAAFVAAATAAGIRDLSIRARHLCLSPQVAAPLAAAGATAVDIAGAPNEQALFALIVPSPAPCPASLAAEGRRPE
jgi:uroporphyrinogen-III synthase